MKTVNGSVFMDSVSITCLFLEKVTTTPDWLYDVTYSKSNKASKAFIPALLCDEKTM